MIFRRSSSRIRSVGGSVSGSVTATPSSTDPFLCNNTSVFCNNTTLTCNLTTYTP